MTYYIPYQATATAQGNIVVQDGSIDTTSTSLALVGPNTVNFGLYINQNFVELLQTFASNTAPTSPLIGQLWYDTISASIKYYNGVQWKVLTPPYDGAAGTATTSILGQAVALTLADSQIIYATSLVPLNQASLPSSVLIDDTYYAMSSRFPQGLGAGITIATDSNGLQVWGRASTANAFASNMTISVTGSANARVSFNGSGNVVMPLALTNVVTAGYYQNVTVGSNGIVTGGQLLNANDISNALGYVPSPVNGVANSLSFGSNIIINGVVGGSNIFYGNSNIIITTTFLDNPMPTNGIIALPTGATIPTGWFIANGQTVVIPNGGGSVVTQNLTSSNLTGCVWIQKVY
jgi:hypothetical protein